MITNTWRGFLEKSLHIDICSLLVTINQHWHDWYPGAGSASGHLLKQCWTKSWRINTTGAVPALQHQLWRCWHRPLTRYDDTVPQWVEKINWRVQFMVIRGSNQSRILGIITYYVLSYECDKTFCNNIPAHIHWCIVLVCLWIWTAWNVLLYRYLFKQLAVFSH